LPDEKIELELKDNELQVTCGRSATKIKGSPADEFPVIPAADGTHGFLVATAEFKKGLSQVLPAVAKNDIRPELSGVAFNFDESGLIMAATDSYRLAEKKIKLSALVNTISDYTLPIFLLHPIIMEFLQNGYFGFAINGNVINQVIEVPMLTFATLAICLAIIIPVSKIPIVKKLVGIN
jgi:DNA polymerase III sliding clamp (beta) subunit (PCNA family)